MRLSTFNSYSMIDPRFFPNISIEKHIERHQLIGILSKWFEHEAEGELKRKAIQAIVTFYDNESNPVSANQPKELDLSKCRLQSLPNLFSYPPFTGLVKLDLSLNRLETLPPMNRLHNLQKIVLRGNCFESIPDTLFDCQNIEHCDLTDNKLLDVSSRIGELKRLTLLNLSTNQLHLLPPEINELCYLENLYLHDNELEELPDLNKLQRCRDISISKNQFFTFPSTLCNLSSLEIINCSENNLSELPEDLKNLQRLFQLDLSNNDFKEFPTCIPYLTNLEELLFDNNQLKDLSNLHLLPNLTVLSISCNLLNQLPSNFILPSLTHLFMSETGLNYIPSFITNCLSLTKLALDDNELEILPDSFSNLTNLEFLSLNINKLHSLPASFNKLQGLQELKLEGNNFTEFPKELLELPRLQKLNLAGNELIEIPSLLPKLENLIKLDISENHLTNLPDCLEDLPSSLTISLDGNLFTVEEVQLIQNIVNSPDYSGPIIEGLGIQEEEEENLPGENITEICNLLFEFSQQTPREFVNLPNDSLALLSWLQRLGEVAEFKAATHKQLLSSKVLDILATANDNPSFREIFFKFIDEASQSCGDRVALSIIHLDISQQLETADLTKIQEISSFLLRGIFAMDLLEKHALKKIKEKKATDDIETYLAYPIKLKQDLDLPFTQADMRYFECSQVTDGDLQEAKNMVLSHLKNKKECISFLINNEVWKKALALNFPKEWQRIENNKKIQLEVDEPDYMSIRNRCEEEIKTLTEKVLHKPETIEKQSLDDPLDVLMNCLEKSQFNTPLAVKYLVDERDNLLEKIFSTSETNNEETLCKLEALLATIYFFYQQHHLQDLELLSFLLPTRGSMNRVSSISSCVKQVLSRNSARLYVELLDKLFQQKEVRNEIFESFSIKEKNPLNSHAKSVNLSTRLIQLTNATFHFLQEQSTETQSIVTPSLFSLLKNIKELCEGRNKATSSKRSRITLEKDMELLLLRFEKLTKFMESSVVLSPIEEIVLQSKDIMGLITNYKKYRDIEECLDQSELSNKEKDLSSTFNSLNEQFKNLCAYKAKEAQKHAVDPMSMIATTWLSGVIRSAPTSSATLPLPPQQVSGATATFSSPSTSSVTTASGNTDRNSFSTNLTDTDAALSRLPAVADTPLRGSERREATRDAASRIAMMDPIYYKKV